METTEQLTVKSQINDNEEKPQVISSLKSISFLEGL